MKTVLIVEDDEYKLDSLIQCVASFKNVTVTVSKSFTNAAKMVKSRKFDLIILDMSLPTYEGGDLNDEGEAQGLGGKSLARLMHEYDTLCNTVLVTQFATYEDFGKQTSVADLAAELEEILGTHFLGFVKYNGASIEWKSSLEPLLGSALTHDGGTNVNTDS